ncbi:MAG: L,D-transpeptidase family protein [Bradymonadia bacterium]
MKSVINCLMTLLLMAGCSVETTTPEVQSSSPPQIDVRVLDARLVDKEVAPDPLANQPSLGVDERILIRVDGEDRFVSEETALAHGYTILDLSDDWVPTILTDRRDENGDLIPNNYRSVYRGLANDVIDADGSPLRSEELNFLEVFGVPPSLGVVVERVLADEKKECLGEIDYDLIGQFEFIPVTKWDHRRQKRRLKKRDRKLAKFRKKHGDLSVSQVEQINPEIARIIKENQARSREKEAFQSIEKRMFCDSHVRKRFRHKKGKRDAGFEKAIRRFQRKHKLYVWGVLEEDTLAALSKPPMVLNYDAFLRALRERIVAAAGIIEDGTNAQGGDIPEYTAKDGTRIKVRNLVEEYLEAAKKDLGIETVEGFNAFVKRHGRSAFESLRAGIRFPQLPEYYSDHMEISLIVDRGSVWYDFPYNEKGRKRNQKRKRFPTISLMLTYNGETFPLAKWRTTIGGWAEEQSSNGYVYLKYKMSDVGKRVIRKIVAAPTWRPPNTTPISTLVKRKWVNGKSQRVVNYNDLGPGYLSAFGIVAGYFVIPGKNGRPDWDKGIRAHGSSNYMSIMSKRGFSHGCHRLQNDRAIRLYGFLLSRRTHKVFGEMEEAFRRMYLYEDEVYEMYLPSQGFKYELDPPIDVEVLEGTIEGKEEEPIEDLMEIPGKEYPVPHDFVDRLEEEASTSDAGVQKPEATDASGVPSSKTEQ